MWNKFKGIIVMLGALVVWALGFFKGKKHQREAVKDEIIKTTKRAKKSRDSLANDDKLNKLHNKYKR